MTDQSASPSAPPGLTKAADSNATAKSPDTTAQSTDAKNVTDKADKDDDSKDKDDNSKSPRPCRHRQVQWLRQLRSRDKSEDHGEEHLKEWMSRQLEDRLQPLHAAQRDIVKSLHELLEDKSKMDEMAASFKTLHNKMEDLTTMVKGNKVQTDLDELMALTTANKAMNAQIAKDLKELAEVSGRRHAYLEVSTDGSQEQSRGLKREMEAIYTSLRDFRSTHGRPERAFSTGVQDAQWLRGAECHGPQHHRTVAEGKEASERTLEVAEKTLAACRVSGPSSSEKEILESLELSLEALKQLVSTPIPPPPNQPVHVPASSHTAPPPPQHAPNLLNITPSSSSGCGGGWGTGPTAAVMLKNPQQIFRVLAGHSGDGSN